MRETRLRGNINTDQRGGNLVDTVRLPKQVKVALQSDKITSFNNTQVHYLASSICHVEQLVSTSITCLENSSILFHNTNLYFCQIWLVLDLSSLTVILLIKKIQNFKGNHFQHQMQNFSATLVKFDLSDFA